MRSPATHSPEAFLRARFGPEALITRLGAIRVVHVDPPTEAELQERLAEVEQDMLESEECGCCELMRPQAGDTIIFDGPMCLIEPAPWQKLFLNLDEGELEGIAHLIDSKFLTGTTSPQISPARDPA